MQKHANSNTCSFQTWVRGTDFQIKNWEFIIGWTSVLQSRKQFLIHKKTYLKVRASTWSRLLEKLTGSQLVKKFPAFYETRRFITAPISVRHLSLSWARSIQSMHPHPISWRSIVILTSHLCLRLPSGLLPSCFPAKTVYASLPPTRYMPCPSRYSLFHHPNNIWRWVLIIKLFM